MQLYIDGEIRRIWHYAIGTLKYHEIRGGGFIYMAKMLGGKI
jgi:hypothetical protein